VSEAKSFLPAPRLLCRRPFYYDLWLTSSIRELRLTRGSAGSGEWSLHLLEEKLSEETVSTLARRRRLNVDAGTSPRRWRMEGRR
jgi:hypothetical protein